MERGMDGQVSQLLASIDARLSSLESKIDKVGEAFSALSISFAEERVRIGELARRLQEGEARDAELARRLEAAQRRLDEADGARRGATAAGVAGVVSGLSGLGAALWAWLTGGGV